MTTPQRHEIHSSGTGWLQRLQSFLHDEGFLVASAPRRPAEPGPAARTAAARRQVLVADDNPVNLMVASEMLSGFNVSTRVAADGAEAVALAGELQLDLILMDLQMPVLDGLSALQQIRAVELARQRPRVPTLAYTSSAPAWDVLQASGFDGLLCKPCGHAELRNSLQRWAPQLLQEAVVSRPRPLRPWPHHAPRDAPTAGVNGPGVSPG